MTLTYRRRGAPAWRSCERQQWGDPRPPGSQHTHTRPWGAAVLGLEMVIPLLLGSMSGVSQTCQDSACGHTDGRAPGPFRVGWLSTGLPDQKRREQSAESQREGGGGLGVEGNQPGNLYAYMQPKDAEDGAVRAWGWGLEGVNGGQQGTILSTIGII